jgi:hypothetical protein
MTRIRLDTAALAALDWIPGQQVRVAVGDAPAPGNPKDWIFADLLDLGALLRTSRLPADTGVVPASQRVLPRGRGAAG